MRSNFVSLHPYFKAHPGKLEAIKAVFPRFMEKTATEGKNLFYGFSVSGDEIFCREGYMDADGVVAHLDNVGARGRTRQAKRTSRASESSVVYDRVQPGCGK